MINGRNWHAVETLVMRTCDSVVKHGWVYNKKVPATPKYIECNVCIMNLVDHR